MADIVIKGKIKDDKGVEHTIEIDLDKGEKEKGKKRRKADRVKILVNGTDFTKQIVRAKKKDKDEDGDIEIEWNSAERNGIGGFSGFADNFSLRVHCPEKSDETDEPYIIVGLTEKAREQLKKAAALGFPTLPEGAIKVKISHKDQDKMNDYFDDPELPVHVF